MRRRFLLPLLGVILRSTFLAAQTEYRNLDAGRPLATQDAYPTARYAFEFTAPFRMERGPRAHRFELSPGLSYGVLGFASIGVEVPWLARTDRGTGFRGEPVQLSALVNFNGETPLLPALSLAGQSDVHGDGILTAIATRSWGRVRTHLNAQISPTSAESQIGVEEPTSRWAASLATDVTLIRSSLLFGAELQFSRPINGTNSWRVGTGARWQFTPTIVLDLGAYRRHSMQAGTEYGLTVGLTQIFGFAALMPGGKR